MIEDEKVFAITKFSKDLLEVRDAIRFALNNNDVEKMKQQVDLAALKENFASNLEG
jgi:molecular chaperone GrpE (heat shock protein)